MDLRKMIISKAEIRSAESDTNLFKRSLVEITGTDRVLIENHHGVLQYSREKILIKVKKGQVEVSGDKLCLVTMNRWQLVICGRIENVRLYGRDE